MQRLDRRRIRMLLIREFKSVLTTLCEETREERTARHDKEARDREQARKSKGTEYRSYRDRGSRGHNPTVEDEPGAQGRTSRCEDSPRQRYDELMKVFADGAGNISIDRLGRVIHYLNVLNDKGAPKGFNDQQRDSEYKKIQRHMASLNGWEEDRDNTIAKIRRARLKTRDLDDAVWPEADCEEIHVLADDSRYEYSRVNGVWHHRVLDSDNEWTTITNSSALERLDSDARLKE